MKTDKVFAGMLKDILDGSEINTRNSITMRKRNLVATFDSAPLISVRKTAWKQALREQEWFLSGSSNINDLHSSVRHWWQPWANAEGIILNNYSKQFRHFTNESGEVDQIEYMVNALTDHPYSRRNIITTWNTADMVDPATPITNCHGSLIGAFVEPSDDTVHINMVQRSADMVLGTPHNWIQYWALLMYLAHRSGRKVGSFTWIGWDCHIYQPHYEMANRIIGADFGKIHTPNLVYTPTSKDFKADDFSLDSAYEPLINEKLVMIV